MCCFLNMMWNDEFQKTNPLPKTFDIIHDKKKKIQDPPLRASKTQNSQALTVLTTLNSLAQ